MKKRLNSFRENVVEISLKDAEAKKKKKCRGQGKSLTHDKFGSLDTGGETEWIKRPFS